MADAKGTLRRFLLLTGLYYAGAVLASLYLRTPDDITLFWPSSGIALAVVVSWGKRWAVVVPFAVIALHLTVLPVPLAFVPYSILSNTLAAVAAGWYCERAKRADGLHLRTADGLMLLRSGLILAATSATIGTAGLLHAGMTTPVDAGRVWLLWALGDILGITTFAPAFALLLGPGGLREGLWRDRVGRREQVVWAIALLLSLAGIVTAGRSGNLYALGLVSMPLALLLWAAVRFSPMTTMVGTILVVTFISLLTGLGLGGFTRPLTLLDASVLMLLLVLISVIPVMLAVATYEQRHTATALYLRATRDPLTGLLNRSTFEERARERLTGETPDPDLSLLYLDLDHFKLVNDSASHVAGDDMIRTVGRMVGAEFGEEALVARTGGDEFAVLVPVSESQAITCGRRLLASIDGLRISWGDQMLTAAASIGIAHSHAPHGDFDSLLSHADAACFAAKEYGGNRLVAASREGDELKLRTASMRSALQVREALDQRRFSLFCQPIIPLDPASSTKRSIEILLRWTDAQGQVRAPAELIAAAERYRLGPRLDRYVVEAVLQWLETHPEHASSIHHCGINLGGGTLVDEEFHDYFAARLRHSSVPPERLCLEITETSVVRDRTRAQRFIQRMRDLGCRLALDDFGTGFCSFGYLQHLDVDYLKIDGSFVRDLGKSELADAVVRSITEIAHVLDKRTVAEQAETIAQLDSLRAMGVDFAQGYAIARPMPIATFFEDLVPAKVG
ncbi:putative bifunctional diguanylate cyclase/phosphodiesterase [Noviluteimonas gilva]|uniref:EAL domain-containing protein n=1 Tax=Noviluteimonas gilva TaxID=2682097 RepID=A0A7C9HP63_9GAMM|nr:EAL domain-containing protein [Lysobacter gilvus]MUV12693.1 EAL domain-containing protein [Lysobacter gilvus]